MDGAGPADRVAGCYTAAGHKVFVRSYRSLFDVLMFAGTSLYRSLASVDPMAGKRGAAVADTSWHSGSQGDIVSKLTQRVMPVRS